MKKNFPFVFAGIAVATLLAWHGSPASISANGYDDNITVDSQQIAIACGPMAPSGKRFSSTQNLYSTFLSDEELSAFKYESMMFNLAPGETDTVSHRHDCDVFVTVLEGSLLMGQEFKDPVTLKAGEVFHEKRNVIHSLFGNPSKDQPTKALVVFIRKDGRARYTPEYPRK